MCIGIPARVIAPRGAHALCAVGDGQRLIDVSLVGPQPAGTWLLTFLDAAREVIDAHAAERIEAALAGLQAALSGDHASIDAFFADLVDRPPQLPQHLRT